MGGHASQARFAASPAWLLRGLTRSGRRRACAQPRLVRFVGRPQDYSPKARLLYLLGYKLPFDRHDWTVDRCGTQARRRVHATCLLPRR